MDAHNPTLLPFVLRRTASGTLITEQTGPEGSTGLAQTTIDPLSSLSRGRPLTPEEKELAEGLMDEGHDLDALIDGPTETGQTDEEDTIFIEAGSRSHTVVANTFLNKPSPLLIGSTANYVPDNISLPASGSQNGIESLDTVVPWPSQGETRNPGVPNYGQIIPNISSLQASGSQNETAPLDPVAPWVSQGQIRNPGVPSYGQFIASSITPSQNPGQGRPRRPDNASQATALRRLQRGRLTVAACNALENDSATPDSAMPVTATLGSATLGSATLGSATLGSATSDPSVNGTRRRLGHMPSSSKDSTSSDQGRKRRRAELSSSDAGRVPANPNGPEQGLWPPDLNVGNDVDVGSASSSHVTEVSDNPPQLQQQMQTSAQTGLASSFINPQTNNHLPNVHINNNLPNIQPTLNHTPQVDLIHLLPYLIPRSFDMVRRRQILEVFSDYARHIRRVISVTGTGIPVERHYAAAQLTQEDEPIDQSTFVEPPLGPTGQGWPEKPLPTEVMEQIVKYLPRDTVQNMRLVNHEFEKRVSSVAFKSVVVPFRAEIYGMMVHDSKAKKPAVIDVKGKGKAKEITPETDNGADEFYPLGDYCKVKAKDVYDGMKVFEAWGSHIKQFAMTFEVDLVTLQNPPVKEVNEQLCSFWGNYIWPLPQYSRYDAVAGLEQKADQTRCMTTALSKLTEVYELGLCVDSGLGWLIGPDVSDRTKLLAHKPKVFGSKFAIPVASEAKRHRTWATVNRLLKAAVRKVFPQLAASSHIALVPGPQPLTNTRLPPIFEDNNTGTAPSLGPQDAQVDQDHQLGSQPRGRPEATTDATQTDSAKLLPAKLTNAQQEWLLETEWAQRAFLSSYCLALIDNTTTFQRVRTLTISKLSSRYLALLQRTDIWAALPKIDNITILVSPDWRNVLKSDEGLVSTPSVYPSDATDHFRSLLETCIVTNQNVKTLQIGWADGGERAPGMFARNKHVLPAPVMDIRQGPDALFWDIPILGLPHVQHLTFTNCWFTPTALKTFVTDMEQASLKTLTLDSVSLTADPKAASLKPAVNPNNVNDMDGEARLLLQFMWSIDTHYVCVGPNGALCFYTNGGVIVTPDISAEAGISTGVGPTDPDPTAWLGRDPRKGSWGEIINTLTPGNTLAYQEYLHGFNPDDGVPAPRQCGNLTRINFNSCGYVRLTNASDSFRQHDIGAVVSTPPPCLGSRYGDLMDAMMDCNYDHFLGQIVPSLPAPEQAVLTNGFGMQMGWGDDEAKWESLEDGQPEGGSGRFSGSVEAMGPGGSAAF